MRLSSTALIVCALSLVTHGCGETLIPTTSTSPAVAHAYSYIPNSTQCPMPVQEAVAAHNSVHASNLLGKETVWKAKPLKPTAPPVPVS